MNLHPHYFIQDPYKSHFLRPEQKKHDHYNKAMFSSFPSTFILFFLASIFSHNLINQTCKKCSETDPNIGYDFCVTSLQAAPRATHTDDVRQLGIISIRLLRLNLTDTRSYIKELLKDKKLDPFVKSCLKDCYDLYSDAVPLTKKAIKEYRGKRYKDANVDLSSVMDASTTCEDGFQEKEGIVSPLTKRNNDTFQLSAISLSITNML